MDYSRIIYIARAEQKENYGGSVVAKRNLNILKDIFGEEKVIEIRLPKTTMKTVLSSLLRLGGYGVPRSIENRICKTQREQKIGYAFIEGSLGSSIVTRLKSQGCKVITFAHNVEKALYRNRYEQDKSLLTKIRLKYIAYCERRVIKNTEYLIALNKRDDQGHYREYGRHSDIILPITFPDRSNSIPTYSKSSYLLFVGSNFFPNNSGITWFIENVAPYIKKYRILVIGGCCKSIEVKSLKLPENVEVLGYVDNLDKYYRDAAAVIAPIFSGSGMKTKTVEALSYGKTIFGTDEAFEGIVGDKDKIGGDCNEANSFIDKINQYSGKVINEYSHEIFLKYYSDDSFATKLRQFFIDIKE